MVDYDISIPKLLSFVKQFIPILYRVKTRHPREPAAGVSGGVRSAYSAKMIVT